MRPTTVLAQETGTITVNANAATVLWGDSLPKFVTQGVTMEIPLRVYSPAEGTGQLTLTVTGPGDDPTTQQTEATRAGDVKVYASNGTAMVPMPLTLNAAGPARGHLGRHARGRLHPRDLVRHGRRGGAGGQLRLRRGACPAATRSTPILVSVLAPEAHGEQPPTSGDDLTPPVLTVSPVGDLGSTASFTITANEDGVTFECMLATNGTAGSWEACESPKTYTDLAAATYTFSARGTDPAGNVSFVVTMPSWTVIDRPDAPTNVVGTSGTAGGSVNLSWTAPANDGGSPITGYEIQKSPATGSPVWTSAGTVGNVTSTTVTGLTQNASYIFQVRAVNVVGPSAWSAASAAVRATRCAWCADGCGGVERDVDVDRRVVDAAGG